LEAHPHLTTWPALEEHLKAQGREKVPEELLQFYREHRERYLAYLEDCERLRRWAADTCAAIEAGWEAGRAKPRGPPGRPSPGWRGATPIRDCCFPPWTAGWTSPASARASGRRKRPAMPSGWPWTAGKAYHEPQARGPTMTLPTLLRQGSPLADPAH